MDVRRTARAVWYEPAFSSMVVCLCIFAEYVDEGTGGFDYGVHVCVFHAINVTM